MSDSPALSADVQDALAFSFGIDTPAKAKMVEAFVKNPKQKPFSSFASLRVDHGAFANVYRHLMYPKSIIRLSTPWTGDAKVERSIKMAPQGHTHYMEQWVIPNQGNRYTPKVEMYVRLSTGETLAIMEHLIPPSTNHPGFMESFKDEFSLLTRMNRNKEEPPGYRNLPKDLQQIIVFLACAPEPYKIDFGSDRGNILIRDCGQMVVTDPLS